MMLLSYRVGVKYLYLGTHLSPLEMQSTFQVLMCLLIYLLVLFIYLTSVGLTFSRELKMRILNLLVFILISREG